MHRHTRAGTETQASCFSCYGFWSRRARHAGMWAIDTQGQKEQYTAHKVLGEATERARVQGNAGPRYGCVFARMNTCAHTRTHAQVHACLHAHTHACTHARTHARLHACTHACTHARMHACTYACTQPSCQPSRAHPPHSRLLPAAVAPPAVQKREANRSFFADHRKGGHTAWAPFSSFHEDRAESPDEVSGLRVCHPMCWGQHPPRGS